MQIEPEKVEKAAESQSIGLRVTEQVWVPDVVYKVTE